MEIRDEPRALAQQLYPDLTPRELGTRINDDLFQLYLRKLAGRTYEDIQLPELPEDHTPPQRTPKETADFIADNAPAIDDTNWSLTKNGIVTATEAGRWDGATLERLLDRLNEPFDKVRNEPRVQNSRITTFFDRLLA